MEYIDKYIPKELLALKINYCRKRLKELPKTSMHTHSINGVQTRIIKLDNHKTYFDSPKGQELYKAMVEREDLECRLKVYEAIWDRYYRTPVPVFEPPKIIRTLRTPGNVNTVMDKEFFDSLKNDANTMYPKPMLYPFNGIQYRSDVERQIAIGYTEMNVPFKYEPELWLEGMRKPIYPDFLLYIPELETCKIHEHYGLMNFAKYVRDAKLKCSTYIDAGLLMDQDVFFTYNTEDQPFDLRYISAKLNGVIYGNLISSYEWINNSGL